MKWISRKIPSLGDTRIITKFALLPITAGGETRWLQSVRIEQTLEENGTYGVDTVWDNTRFIDDKKVL